MGLVIALSDFIMTYNVAETIVSDTHRRLRASVVIRKMPVELQRKGVQAQSRILVIHMQPKGCNILAYL